MSNPSWMYVKSPHQGQTRLSYDPERRIIRRVITTLVKGFHITRTEYRYEHCKTWVRKIADLGPSEPDYSI